MDKIVKTIVITNKINMTTNFLNSRDLAKRDLYLGTKVEVVIYSLRSHL